ncbi:BatA and WFA domain-containing protein [Sutcliffiella horikoshii]|uniref:vWA domain-containing protein n=1 Tax=Sutcliffiella horikoshii TaxID=79883 RepID=UPI001CC00196|nr:VWA domain-containing protein [Sutcliffiella horikoshii]UAL45650.1 BatA and WFA domain-containing protein [Sutcliffiella horikoshii]
MGFTAPIYFLFSAFLLLVILMYFFRKQYEKKAIPSVLLWQEWMNEFEAQAWWRKLQHHLLLYLQLLALLFLIFTLTQPFFEKEGIEGDHIVFIVDTSASMTALEGEKSRLELAKEKMVQTLDKIDHQEMTVIVAKETPEILLERSQSPKEAVELVENLGPSYVSANVIDSINMAKSLLGEENGNIQLLTDNFSKEAPLELHNNTTFFAHNIGNSHQNLAVETFGVTMRENQVVGVVTVKNEGNDSMDFNLSIYNDQEEDLQQVSETVEGNKVKTIYLEELPPATMYRAVVSGDKQYKLDNEQFAFLGQQQDPTVYVHKDIHPFARKAVEIASTNVIHLSSNSAEEIKFDGVHLIKGVERSDWPSGPKLVFLSGEDGEDEVVLSGEVSASMADPLMQSVEMENVYVEKAFSSKEFSSLDVVASRGETPLILSGIYEGDPIIVVTFELGSSDWPLHPGFPLFMFHSIQELTQNKGMLGYFYPGQTMDYFPASDVKKAEILDKDDKVVFSYETFEQPMDLPLTPGLYTLRETMDQTEESRTFTIMLEESEKSIKTEESFNISAVSSGDQEKETTTSINISYLFLLLALVVLLVEWEVYRRGISN